MPLFSRRRPDRGLAYLQRGELAKAEAHFKQSLAKHQDISERLGQAHDLGNLGLVYASRGELDKAKEHHQKALAIHQELGNSLGQATQLGNLGLVCLQRGEPSQAEELFKQALNIAAAIDDRLGEANQIGNLGWCAPRLGIWTRRGALPEALAIHQGPDRLGEAKQLATWAACISCGAIGLRRRSTTREPWPSTGSLAAGGPGAEHRQPGACVPPAGRPQKGRGLPQEGPKPPPGDRRPARPGQAARSLVSWPRKSHQAEKALELLTRAKALYEQAVPAAEVRKKFGARWSTWRPE